MLFFVLVCQLWNTTAPQTTIPHDFHNVNDWLAP